MKVTPVAGSLGAELSGVDLVSMDDDAKKSLREAIVEHEVVFIRDAFLNIESAHKRVVGVELVNANPALKLVESHQIEHEGIGLGPLEMGQVGGQTSRGLGHGLHCGNRHTPAPTLLAKKAEILFTVGRDLADHGDPLMAVLFQPADHQCGIATTVTIAEPEAVVTVEALGPAPADEGHFELVGQRADGDRIIGAVGAGHCDAAFIHIYSRRLRNSAKRHPCPTAKDDSRWDGWVTPMASG